MNIQKQVSLAPYTTFCIGGKAAFFVEVSSYQDLIEALAFAHNNSLPFFVLGSGSNVLISDQGFTGLIVKLNIKGFVILSESNKEVLIEVGAGNDWDALVAKTVENDWWGIENLSSIPGTVGASPVQNINAYGQHVGDCVDSVKVFDTKTNKIIDLTNDQCQFTYRKSIFNSKEKGRYIVIAVVYRLSKQGVPSIQYPDLIKYFADLGIDKPTQQQTRNAIIEIRARKFPDLTMHGTAGSFFKNLLVSPNEYQEILAKVTSKFGDERARELDNIRIQFSVGEEYKIPTGFVVDKLLNLKGMKIGNALLSQQQAITVVNENKKALAVDVMSLFKSVREKVYESTGVVLENEPEFLGFLDDELAYYYSLK